MKRYFATWILPVCFIAINLSFTGCGKTDAELAEALAEPTNLESAKKTPVSPADSTTGALFAELMDEAKAGNWHSQDLGEVMMRVGVWFTGQPYVAGTLDASAYEKLVIKLDGFDCVTFVESSHALARTIKAQAYSYEAFVGFMETQRYRAGVLDGYCSRLHYFTEWIIDNEDRGHVNNITQDIGGEVLDKQINFMSTHRSSYPKLESDSLYAGIVEMEERLKTVTLHYIPQKKINTVYNQLKPGDIIALATDIKGLDISHTGLVFKDEEGKTGLLHASTANGVVVSPDLQAYVENNKRQIGIVIARPIEL